MDDEDFYDDEADDNPFDMDNRCSDCRCFLRGVTEYVYGLCDKCRGLSSEARAERKDA